MFCLDVGAGTPIICFVLYGWSGGRSDPSAALRTNGLIAAVGEEAKSHPEYSCCAMGDLNGDPEHFPALRQLLAELAWVDVGAVASMWGHKDAQVTCQGYNTTQGTRNDYFLCQSSLLPYIGNFEVVSQQDFAVHSILRVTWSFPRQLFSQTINLQPRSMATTLQELFNSRCSTGDTDECKSKPSKEDWTTFLAQFHQILDAKLEASRKNFQDHLACGSTTLAWDLWCRAVEEAYVCFL